jgi:hypothetical protein
MTGVLIHIDDADGWRDIAERTDHQSFLISGSTGVEDDEIGRSLWQLCLRVAWCRRGDNVVTGLLENPFQEAGELNIRFDEQNDGHPDHVRSETVAPT